MITYMTINPTCHSFVSQGTSSRGVHSNGHLFNPSLYRNYCKSCTCNGDRQPALVAQLNHRFALVLFSPDYSFLSSLLLPTTWDVCQIPSSLSIYPTELGMCFC